MDGLIDWWMDWLTGGLNNGLIDWLMDWLTGGLNNELLDGLVDKSIWFLRLINTVRSYHSECQKCRKYIKCQNVLH